MKKKLALLFTLVLLLVMVAPSFAWNGVSGTLIDSVDKDPWLFGGDVWIVNNTNGNILGTGTLAANGTFNIAFGTDGLVCGCVTNVSANGDALEVIIIPNPGPNGAPGVASKTFTQNPIPARYATGYLETGTGPTAISLQGFGGTSNLPLVAGLMVVLMAGVTFVAIRRRNA